MKGIVITGATSMIGAALARAALADGAEVYAIVRPDTRRVARLPQDPGLHLVYCALDRLQSAQLPESGIDAFYHLAWKGTSKAERDDPRAQEENIRLTLDAVALAKRVGCRRFVGVGSQAEYGPVEGVISESTPPNPVIAYGMAKLSANLLSRRLCEQQGLTHIWARVFSVYGVNDNEGTMLNYALDRFDRGETARFSAAKQMWNYLFETDAGEMLYALGREDVPGGIYPIAHPESRVLRTYIEEMQSVYGRGARCEFAPESPNVYGLQVDMSKTLAATGFVPKVGFREGIAEVIQKRSGAL